MKNIKKISEFKSKLKEDGIFAECLVFIDNEQFDKAANCFTEIIRSSPGNANAMFGKALSLYESNEWGKALQVLDFGLKKDPNNVYGLIMRAEMMTALGRLELALDCFDKLIEISPTDKYYYLGKAEILEDLGKSDEALHCYETGLKMDSDNKEVQDEPADITIPSESPAPEPMVHEPEPVPEIADKPVMEPIIEETAEPVPEIADEPAMEPIIEEPETILEPVDETEPEPMPEALDEPASEDPAEPEYADEAALEELVEELEDDVEQQPEPETAAIPEEIIEPWEEGKKVMFYRGFEMKGVLDDAEEIPLDYPEEEWKTGPEKKTTRRNSAISLVGIFCIMTIAIYLMFITVGVIYDCFTIDMDFNILWPNALLFILGFGALYGGMYVAKNSIIYDHFLDSMFDNEIYPRLEPALEEVAEVQARLEDIDERIDRVNLNFVRYKRHPPVEEYPSLSIDSKINMFLKFIVTINITIGVLLYVLTFPGSYNYAPYLFTMMFVLWWVVITEEYKLWKTSTAWAWAILPIFTVPVISILLSVIINIGILIGIVGIFLMIYVYGYFTWARYYVEGSLPFGMHEADLHTENSEK